MSVKYSVSTEKREELNALSIEVFRRKSRWVKMCESGVLTKQTRTVSETVPGEKEGDPETTREIEVPVGYGLKGVVTYMKKYTVEEVEAEMRKLKEFQDSFRKLLADQKAAQAAAQVQAQLEKDVATTLTGSAL